MISAGRVNRCATAAFHRRTTNPAASGNVMVETSTSRMVGMWNSSAAGVGRNAKLQRQMDIEDTDGERHAQLTTYLHQIEGALA